MSTPPCVLAPAEVAFEAAFLTVLARLFYAIDGLLYWASHSRYLLITRAKIWLKIVASCIILRSKNSSTKMNSLHTASMMSLFYERNTSSKWNCYFLF